MNIIFLYLIVIQNNHSNALRTLQIVRRLLEPLITADTFGEQPVTTLYELCQKSGKDVKFHIWQKGKTTTVNVLIDSELVGYGSSKQKTIARLNAARDALEKLNGEKSNLLIKSQRKEVGDEEEAKQKLNEFCMKRHWPPPVYKYVSSFHLYTIIGTLIFSIIYFVCIYALWDFVTLVRFHL